jgi:hypothetical protein
MFDFWLKALQNMQNEFKKEESSSIVTGNEFDESHISTTVRNYLKHALKV